MAKRSARAYARNCPDEFHRTNLTLELVSAFHGTEVVGLPANVFLEGGSGGDERPAHGVFLKFAAGGRGRGRAGRRPARSLPLPPAANLRKTPCAGRSSPPLPPSRNTLAGRPTTSVPWNAETSSRVRLVR